MRSSVCKLKLKLKLNKKGKVKSSLWGAKSKITLVSLSGCYFFYTNILLILANVCFMLATAKTCNTAENGFLKAKFKVCPLKTLWMVHVVRQYRSDTVHNCKLDVFQGSFGGQQHQQFLMSQDDDVVTRATTAQAVFH